MVEVVDSLTAHAPALFARMPDEGSPLFGQGPVGPDGPRSAVARLTLATYGEEQRVKRLGVESARERQGVPRSTGTSVSTMGPAIEADTAGVASMSSARCDWMERRGVESWCENVDDLVGRAGSVFVWVLTDGERVVGCSTVMTQAPPKDRTASRGCGTCAVPVHGRDRPRLPGARARLPDRAVGGRPGCVAGPPVGGAGCFFFGLVEYDATQGFSSVKEWDRGAGHLYPLARRADRIDLSRPGLASVGF